MQLRHHVIDLFDIIFVLLSTDYDVTVIYHHIIPMPSVIAHSCKASAATLIFIPASPMHGFEFYILFFLLLMLVLALRGA